VYLEQQKQLRARLTAILRDTYEISDATIAIEQPPDIRMGEFALPIAFELARKLKKAPRKIAEELISQLSPLSGFASFEIAGAGYINARLDRQAALLTIARDARPQFGGGIHSLVEHTSINPNKAAHVGHLRNAILGDTFVRLLRAAGQKVDVQNYIDNTGVQVADIVVGLTYLEKLNLEDVRSLLVSLQQQDQRIDYYCWDLYARVSQWYTADATQLESRKKLRLSVLHELETGNNPTSDIAELISTAVLRRHLETMQRLDIEYDFLPRESEILHLHFWDLAFEQLKQKGVLYFETEGKNKGCWVMRRPGASQVAEGATDEDAKVIVRSNGTVTYVGKDIAYHLWKFGLLGRDFSYLPFYKYPDHECWISAESGEGEHPHFGGAQAIYNVIDSRQSDPQSNVIEALRGMGYTDAAARYTHFSYEMVALTPRCALELGYEVAEEDRSRAYIEVSGRKGFGVKADDLIDKLISAAKTEVDARHPERTDEDRLAIATRIAVGALRYFMLKFTRNSVIAFDFREALSFEGETGPYVQYAVVRARSIFRKAETTAEAVLAAFDPDIAGVIGSEDDSSAVWELWVTVSRTSLVIQQSIATAEPAYLAKHAFQLAQQFNNFYHRHHITSEKDAAKKQLLLATAAVAERELVRLLACMGVQVPDAM